MLWKTASYRLSSFTSVHKQKASKPRDIFRDWSSIQYIFPTKYLRFFHPSPPDQPSGHIKHRSLSSQIDSDFFWRSQNQKAAFLSSVGTTSIMIPNMCGLGLGYYIAVFWFLVYNVYRAFTSQSSRLFLSNSLKPEVPTKAKLDASEQTY